MIIYVNVIVFYFYWKYCIKLGVGFNINGCVLCFLCYDLIYMFKVCYNVCVFLICIREILFYYNEFMVWICNIMLYKFVIKFVKRRK